MPGPRSTRPPYLAIVALFTVSGAAGLLYEVAWVRRLTLVFGNTTYAASMVLALFFLGLAVGAAAAARWSARLRRPLHAYGILELAVGAYAVATPWLFDAALPLYRTVYRAAPEQTPLLLAVQLVICAAILGPPTCALGATLPVLSAGLARGAPGLSTRIGRLYGWNTAGAAAGTFVTGFVLLGTLGVTRTIWCGAAASAVVGLLALALARAEEPLPAVPAPTPASGPAGRPFAPRVVLGVMAVSGGLGLAYELVWTRLSVYALSTTAYAFAVMLCTALVGIAAGGLLAARALRTRRATPEALAWTQLGIGLTTAVSVWALLQLPALNRSLHESPLLHQAWGFYGFRFAQCFLVMLLPTLLLGASFPIAVDLLAPGPGRTARTVGRLYAWNTVGGVCGSLLAGFAFIPALGTLHLVRLGVALNGLLAVLVATARPGRPRIPLIGGAALALVGLAAVGLRDVSLDPLLTAAEFGSVVQYRREGITGTVTIHEYPETGVRVLSINGCNVAGTTLPLLTTQKIQGHIPALLHGRARSAMQIGFGSGETAKVLTLHGVDTVHGVEISPEVIAAGDYLAELNGGVAYSSRFRPIIMDAVNYARLTDRTYDLILNDATFPGLAGSSALYTRDHFAACAARLNPGGIFSCWLPLDIPPPTFRLILASLADVFPHTQLWLATNCDNKNALLVGSAAPIRVDLSAWDRHVSRPDVRRDLQEIRIADAGVLTSYLLLDTAGMRAVAAGAPLNTHDRPRLEYAPFSSQGYAHRWATNLEAVLAHPPDLGTLLSPASRTRLALVQAVARSRAANTLFLAGLQQELYAAGPEARNLYERALAVLPSHQGAQYTLAKLRGGIRRAEAAAAAAPGDPAARLRLAEAYWRGGEPARALPLLERVLATRPGPDVEELYAACALALRDSAAAESVMGRILARHPDDATWRFNAALVHELAGRAGEAAEAYGALLADAPEYRPARFALAKLRMGQGAYRESERVLRADAGAEADAQWHHLLALACTGQGRLAEAREAAERAVEMDPQFLEARMLHQLLARAE